MANPKPVEVKVFVYPGQEKPYVLEAANSILKAGVLTFKNNNHPGFRVSFTLANAEKTGYYFPDDAQQALAVAEITSQTDNCPTQGQKWPEFTPFEVNNDNKTLVVINTNMKHAEFAFTLFVTLKPHDANPHFLPLDPIGSNQNGPRGGRSIPPRSIALVIGGGLLLAAGLYTCSNLRG
jgi:hypothetical protein